jgi:hypothetical protein
MGKTKETYYKVLNADGTCYHGGHGQWHLPQDGQPGEWMPKIEGKLRPCVNGYHILKREHLIEWIAPVAVFQVEVKGRVQWDGNKGVVRQARLVKRIEAWTEQTARLFACDCAEHYREELPTSEHADFDKYILTIRRYAFGWVTEAELEGARAWAWAWAWARARAWVWAGAWAWAWARTWAGAKAWETDRLFEYLDGKVDIEAIKRSVQP